MSCTRQLIMRTGVLALVIIALDQLCKWWMLEHINIDGRDAIVVTSFFKLVMVWNHGISFGMLSHPETYVPIFLIVVALLICAVIMWMAYKSTSRVEQLAYGMIIGGALGNVIDRIRFGAVADFFSFHIGEWYYPAFNIADASIFLGVAVLIVASLRQKKTRVAN